MIDYKEFIENVFSEGWGNMTMIDFFSIRSDETWKDMTIDQDAFDDWDENEYIWEKWDHSQRMYELEGVAEGIQEEWEDLDMSVSLELDNGTEEAFMFGVHKDILPLVKALGFWDHMK